MPQQTLPVRATRPGGPDGVLPQPQARRLRRPTWRDPRLLVGLVLVLTSVLVGAFVVAHADDSQPVWATRRALTPGQQVDQADLVVRQVRISGGAGQYVSADTSPSAALVLLRSVGAGELLPVTALGRRDQVTLRPVAVPVAEQEAQGLRSGALVDVWVAARNGEHQDAFERPHLVAAGAQVSVVSEQRGALGGSTTSSVRLLMTADLVPTLIEAVDNDARVTLVPLPAALVRNGS